ncbi:MAG: hypothetical protein H0U49_02405, partial [Parachlamydiaceae bacterium]|nr:hypothetical protein [Parachlamydiaceae bacterium]
MNFSPIYRDPKLDFPGFQTFNDEICEHLTDAENFVDNVLNPPVDVTAEVRVKAQRPRTAIVCYSLGYPCCYGPRFSLFNFNSYNYAPAYGRREKDDTGQRLLIGLIGAVVAGAAVYLLGGFLNERSRIVDELSKINSLKTKIDAEVLKDPEQPDLVAIKKVVDGEQGIFKQIKQQADIKLSLLVSAAVSGVFLTIGAIVAAQGLMIAGGVLGLGVMLGTVFNLGFTSTDKEIVNDARHMGSALAALKEAHKPFPSKAAP